MSSRGNPNLAEQLRDAIEAAPRNHRLFLAIVNTAAATSITSSLRASHLGVHVHPQVRRRVRPRRDLLVALKLQPVQPREDLLMYGALEIPELLIDLRNRTLKKTHPALASLALLGVDTMLLRRSAHVELRVLHTSARILVSVRPRLGRWRDVSRRIAHLEGVLVTALTLALRWKKRPRRRCRCRKRVWC